MIGGVSPVDRRVVHNFGSRRPTGLMPPQGELVLIVPSPTSANPVRDLRVSESELTRGWLRHATATGRLVHPVTGAYVAAEVSSPWRNAYYAHPHANELWRALTAAAAVLPPEGALADETAAHVWCGWWPRLETPSVVVAPGVWPLRRSGLRCRTASLTKGEVVRVQRLPVTSAARTAIDLARRLPRLWAVAAVDAFLHARLVAPDQLQRELLAAVGGRGVRQARHVVELADAGAASPGESLTRIHLLDAGLGPIQTQVPLLGGLYLGDLVVRGRLIVEFEGRRHDDEDQFAADRRRFNALAQLPDMGLLRLTWADRRNPAALQAQARAALRSLGDTV